MPKVIKLRKGLDVPLSGEADLRLDGLSMAPRYAVTPVDFEGVTPKLLVQQGDQVKVGTPLLFSKEQPRVLFASPVSGRVSEIVRGEKRRLLAVVVEPDGEQTAEKFDVGGLAQMPREALVEVLLRSGMWPFVIQRPYGIIADPADEPKAIFVSGFDSAPLAPDMNFVLDGRAAELQAGFDALAKLTPGKVHLGLRAGTDGVLNGVKGVERHLFAGPHPAGNVGVQIHHLDPINKGEKVWTVDVQAVAAIGRLMLTGSPDFTRTVALTGPEVSDARYVKVISGAAITSVLPAGNICSQELYLRGDWNSVRIVCGNALTGRRVEHDGYLGFYCNQITALTEGDNHEFLGWAMPRLGKFSVSRSYLSWLTPWRRYDLDTNLNGGERAYVFTGLFDRYLPMDIYPLYLVKAILAGDIDKMENLGIYEVIEEDLALCEFVDPSKTQVQQTIRDGINLMIKEL